MAAHITGAINNGDGGDVVDVTHCTADKRGAASGNISSVIRIRE